jgi:hypothetical protein
MARALIAVGALLALCFAILGLVVFLSRSEDQIAVDNQLAENLTRAVAVSEERREGVDLRRLAPFAWDRVLVVAPGATAGQVSRALGSSYKTDLPLPTGETVLVFAAGDRLVRFADYRGRGAFAGFDRPVAVLRRPDAVLRVRGLVVSPG